MDPALPLEAPLIQEAARLFQTSPAALRPVSGGHFALVYDYTKDNRDYILRISPPEPDTDLQSTQAILEWLAFLAENGGPVCRPLRSILGNLIECIGSPGETYLAGAVEKAKGVLAEEMPLKAWDNRLFQALGRTLGRCHRIAQKYNPPSENYRRPDWEQGGSCFNPLKHLIGADAFILERRKRILETLQSLPKDPENYGLAHLDLHFGNFFVDAATQQITLFDFDDCAYGWYVMDIAMLLFDVVVVYDGSDKILFGKRFLENLLRGYKSEKRIELFWVCQIPHFLKLLEVGIYSMLYRDYDPATAGKWARKFMPDRAERIKENAPYLDLDYEEIFRLATMKLRDETIHE